MQLDLPNANSCGSSSSSSSSSLIKPSFQIFHTPIESDSADNGDSNTTDGDNNLKIQQIDKIDMSIQDNINRSNFNSIDGKHNNGVKSFDDINDKLDIENNGNEKTKLNYMLVESEKTDNGEENLTK